MATFADRLRAEIEYSGMIQKEIAYKANIKKRALDMYLGSQASMPPADIAVRLAKILNVSVEYLVAGEEIDPKSSHRQYQEIVEDLSVLPDSVFSALRTMIHAVAESEKNKRAVQYITGDSH